MRVISIDPGYDRVGIALVEKEQGKEFVVFSECFTTDKKQNLNARIYSLAEHIYTLIVKYSPEYMAIEGLFFSKNTKTALGVAEARGAIIFQAGRCNIPIFEYTPNQIKVAVAGYGGATKKDIFTMITRLVDLDSRKRIDDELDAIAVGLTFLASYRPY